MKFRFPVSTEITRSFESFYREYRLYIHGLCRLRFADTEDTYELESIVWTEVYQVFERFQTENPRTLLYQLVAWRARDLYRKKYKEQELLAELEVEDYSLLLMMEQSSSVLPTHELRMTLVELLQLESPEDRELLYGRFVEELSWKELAEKTKMHRNSLQKRAQASLHRLRERLQAETLRKSGT